jgi:hypothetical protein
MKDNLLGQLKNSRRKFECYERLESEDGAWSWINDPDSNGSRSEVYYGDIKEDFEGKFIEVPFCTWSDYSGSTVERSNSRVLLEQLKTKQSGGFWPLYGGYNTQGMLVSIALLESDEDLQDTIAGLFDYPCIDDEDMSELENEIENEDWDSWIKDDLKRALDAAGIEYPEDDEELCKHFNQVVGNNDIYYIHEDAVSAWIELDEVVAVWNSHVA